MLIVAATARGQQRVTGTSGEPQAPPSPPRVTSGSPPPCLTWGAGAALSARSRSRGAPGTCPHPAPAPRAGAPTTPGRHLHASPSGGRPFLRKARSRLLLRRPGFSKWLLGAVAVTRLGSALPESPLRPVSHGRGPGATRTFFSRARQPVYGVHSGARSRLYGLSAVCARRLRAPSAAPLRPAHACSVPLDLIYGIVFRGWVPEMQSVLFLRPGCAVAIRLWRKSSRLLELSVTESITHRFSLCRPYLGIRHYTYILDWNPICCLLLSEESKILFNQELKQTKNQKSVCVWGNCF